MKAYANSFGEVIYRGVSRGFIENGVYKTPRAPKHFMRKFSGFGISEEILTYLEERKVTKIIIMYDGKRGRINWLSTVNDFRKSPNVHYDGKDRQKFVPTHFMTKVPSSSV